MAKAKRGVAARRGRSGTTRGTGPKSTRRTARPARRAAPAIFHTVDPSHFTTTTDAHGFERRGPAPGQRTSCCDVLITRKTSIAMGRASFAPGKVVRWCPKAVPA